MTPHCLTIIAEVSAKYKKKKEKYLFKVTKEEAEFIRKHAKNAFVTTTGKKKNARQKKRYVDESIETKKLLKKYREQFESTKCINQ